MTRPKKRSKKTPPAAPPPFALTPGIYVVSRVFDFLGKIVDGTFRAFDWRVLLVIAATCLGAMALLPASSRLEASRGLIHELVALAAPPVWLPFLGWIVAAALASVGSVYFIKQEKRIAQLGEGVREQREAEDPTRLSSQEPERLTDYAKKRSVAAGSKQRVADIEEREEAPPDSGERSERKANR